MARQAPVSAKAAVTGGQSVKQEPDLRVGLAVKQGSVTVSLIGGKGTARTAGGKGASLAAGQSYDVRWQNGAFLVGREKLRGEVLTVRPSTKADGAGEFTLNGRRYRGALELRHKGGGLTAVNVVPVDGYLRSVVPEEMPVDWPAEAIKAQSGAALRSRAAAAMPARATTSARRRTASSTPALPPRSLPRTPPSRRRAARC